MVRQANSGHPGTPMDIAPVAYTLWQRFLRFDPSDPIWPNRDRFVLSEGHASALLWSLLHLSRTLSVEDDYEVLGEPAVTLDDLKTFRKLGSHCPDHPEYRWTSGVEATTGPDGQGVAMSVGMAIAQRWWADRFNRQGYAMFDFNVYALAGDGCMMEGVASEAASLAARDELAFEGIGARVVSMPCWELFERQTCEYRDTVLPPSVGAGVAVEQASSFGWDRYVGDRGAVVGMHTFGASAPLEELQTKFGFTTARVADVARETLAALGGES
jgi:transketolase